MAFSTPRCIYLGLAGLASKAVLALHAPTEENDNTPTYEAFREKFGHRSGADIVAYDNRRALFDARLAETNVHNLRADVSWKETLNQFADYTEGERQEMLGYVRVGARWGSHFQSLSDGGSFLEMGTNESSRVMSLSEMHALENTEVDWRMKAPKSTAFHRNQGGCGSCWAVAAVGALEVHGEIKSGKTARLSHKKLVNCVPNPHHCGGDGGCAGATAELAFQFVKENGLNAEDNSESQHAQCNGRESTPNSMLTTSGYTTLPINKLHPLLDALVKEGPASVSVDGTPWFSYHSGVFAGCGKDAIVNHAVLAVGYGKTSAQKYFLIRNSWGEHWGEAGFMRIKRHDGDADDWEKDNVGFCGWDHKPKEGVFCEDAPPKVPVCGMCGILSDSVYPTDVAWKGA